MRGFEGGDQRSRVDGHDGDDDAGQEDGRQLVDIFHTHKNQQRHQEEADGAVNTHVVQHGCPFAFWVFGLENGCLWSDVHLEEASRYILPQEDAGLPFLIANSSQRFWL